MKIISSNGYKVIFEDSSFKGLKQFLKNFSYSQCFILCDENTLQYCLPVLVSNCPSLSSAEIIEVESGEHSKDIEISKLIWQTLIEHKADRDTLFINLGGGVITDLGGFSASLYKRGVSFIHLPTTLLAMADASVGGKTAIDFEGVKNVIGSFAQPAAVYINPAFLKTLPTRHYLNGLAEVYKIALVNNATFWKALKTKITIEALILTSVKEKNKIVLADPYDKGKRQVLNFGHTIGHALEALYLPIAGQLLHGEAVVAGMCVEAHLSMQKKLITKKQYTEIIHTLTEVFSLPVLINFSPDLITSYLGHDKKSKGKQVRFVLLNKIGGCKINQTVTPKQLELSLQVYKALSDAGA